MANGHMKRCSPSLISEKCISKLQCGTTSHWSEWPSLKSLQITVAREGIEERKGNPLTLLVECVATVENSSGGSSEK